MASGSTKSNGAEPVIVKPAYGPAFQVCPHCWVAAYGFLPSGADDGSGTDVNWCYACGREDKVS